jgi:hypothetical protein
MASDGVLDVTDDGADDRRLIVSGQCEEPLGEDLSWYHGPFPFVVDVQNNEAEGGGTSPAALDPIGAGLLVN